ncbi:hypothetical protein Zmor_027384 [Zophobas morio]|uniref:Uncharacterized protein n=1 Tax=Zophobas morio TaxID=2755281 RepID=A0AA38HN22_9CUCU|nr:hypothetical protein Zmor_027384 [Zophobas morio]
MATNKCLHLLRGRFRDQLRFCRHLTTQGPLFPGAQTTWTSDLTFVTASTYTPIPVYRVMDRKGACNMVSTVGIISSNI